MPGRAERRIYAELAGYGSTADAFHVTAPHEKGEGGRAAILQALASAEANPEDVGYINAHGTATQLNDLSETKAIKGAFGELARRIPVSSTKSMTGHMMGATGALEVVFCVQAIREGILPPTIHYRTPDPECDLDIIPNQARETKIDLAISNAFGFGGHNAVLGHAEIHLDPCGPGGPRGAGAARQPRPLLLWIAAHDAIITCRSPDERTSAEKEQDHGRLCSGRGGQEE